MTDDAPITCPTCGHEPTFAAYAGGDWRRVSLGCRRCRNACEADDAAGALAAWIWRLTH